MNLLKQLTEVREMFYLLDYWFIIKGYNSGTGGERCIGQDLKKGHGTSVPSLRTPLSPNHPLLTKPEILQTLSFGAFMEASLHRYDWLNHWPLVTELRLQTFSPTPEAKGRSESSNPLITQLTWLATSPPLQVWSKSHFIDTTKDTSIT